MRSNSFGGLAFPNFQTLGLYFFPSLFSDAIDVFARDFFLFATDPIKAPYDDRGIRCLADIKKARFRMEPSPFLQLDRKFA